MEQVVGRAPAARLRWWCRCLAVALVVSLCPASLEAPPSAQATSVTFAFALASPGADFANAVVVDSAGNVYVGGSYDGTLDFDPGPGTTSRTAANGGTDYFIAKYSPAGALLWVKTSPGPGFESVDALAIDASGLYVTGTFSGTVDFGLGNLTSFDDDTFVLELSPADASTLWQRQFTSNDLDRGAAIAVSGTGVYVTGRFQGTINVGGSDLVSAGGDDIYVARLNASSGAHVWSTRFGGASTTPGEDQGLGIATDGTGVYVTGRVVGSVNLGGGPLPPFGENDIFFLRLAASNGAHVWSQTVGGVADDEGRGVAVDATGVFFTGAFRRTADFGGGALSAGGADDNDADVFVVKYALADGAHLWSKRFGGTAPDDGRAITVNGGHVYVTGRFQGSVNFGPTLVSTTFNGSLTPDIFVAALAGATGNSLTAYRMGGVSTADTGAAIAVNGTTVVTAGRFNQTGDFGAGVTTLDLVTDNTFNSFVSSVSLANVAPTLSAPASAQAAQNGTLRFGTPTGNAIAVADPDVGTGEIQLLMSVSTGTLSLASTSGLTFTSGDGTNDASMIVKGTLTNLNAALNGLAFTPPGGFTGAATINIIASDQGFSGVDGAKTDAVTVNIAVSASTVQCTPRPLVTIQTTKTAAGQLQTVITAVTQGGVAQNALLQIQFLAAENARFDLTGVPGGPVNSPGNVTVPLPANTTTVTLVTRRQGAGQFRLPFTVTDGCGTWPTFVGGGPSV